MNGHAGRGEGEGSSYTLDMPVREKKPSVKRSHKDDGSLDLTKNANYIVKKLPGFPTRLSKDPAEPFRAFVLPSTAYALALTHEHALGWDYTSTTAPSKVHCLPLPFGLKRSDPLPLGCVVRSGPSSEFGLVVVAPTTGKVTFWENVDSAEARSHFPQRHQGVDGSVGRMLSGETIVDIVDVEHAGYVLIFSTGRLAQLTLRDSQGRPHINVYFLRNGSGGGGGFLENLKSALGGGLRREIASVKARPSESKGQMEVITASKTGIFQLWDLSWAGQHIFKGEVDTHAELLATLRDDNSPELQGQQDVRILDFAILRSPKTRGMEVSLSGAPESVGLLILVAFAEPSHLSYSLVEVDLIENSAVVQRVIPLHAYHQEQILKEPAAKLLLPPPGHTALVQFNDAIVVASLAESEESPDTQLMSDSGKPPLPFQDTIYFRKDSDVQFVGSALEDLGRKDKQSSCIFFIRGFGIMQVAALPPTDDDQAIERQRVTALSKLEQATFFSTKPENIIDFSIKSRYNFGQQEVQQAAEHISSNILSSSSEFIEVATSSMEDQLKKRSAALKNLALHLKSDYPPLSFSTRWGLLWDAEKMAAALQVWRHYDERMQLKDVEQRPLMSQLVEMLHERYKSALRPEQGELDPVRQWFVRDIRQLQVVIPWAYKAIRETFSEGTKDHPSIMRLIGEADDLTLGALEIAFAFREENSELYGLDPDCLDDGVLKLGKGYEHLPPIWTSTHNIVTNTRQLVDLGRKLAIQYFEQGNGVASIETLARKIASENPRLVKICCQIHTERYQWCLGHKEEQFRATGQNLKAEFEGKVRNTQLFALTTIGMVYEGMELAERFRDMPTLVELVWAEVTYLYEMRDTVDNEVELIECRRKLKAMNDRIRRYFEKYGDDWAVAFYSSHIDENRAVQLFAKDYLDQPALTKFLRDNPSRAKLGWINEVLGEKDFTAAGAALINVARHQESNSWCKKVELSLAKLALLCGDGDSTPRPEVEELKRKNLTELRLVAIQEKVYNHFRDLIFGALDETSAMEMLINTYGEHAVHNRPALGQVLHQGFEEILGQRVMEPGLLIDVLTLMDQRGNESENNVGGQEFWLALQVLDLCWHDMDKTTRESTLKIIWKRCYIRDDWAAINNTTNKSDEQIEHELSNTALFWTLREMAAAIGDWKQSSNMGPLLPNEVVEAGCSTNELASRFPSEDLRNPIIQDNIADDELLQDYLTKCRLEHWYKSCKEGSKNSLDRHAEEAQRDRELIRAVDSVESASGSLQDDGLASETTNTDAPDGFDGDDEESVDVDVEMEDQ